MIVFPTAVKQLLDDGRIDIIGLIRFEFGTGTYGFAKSDQPVTYNALEYLPGGILEVSNISSNSGLYAQNFTIKLAASPDDGLTPEVLQTIEAEDYKDRPVIISDMYLHPDTGAVLHVQPLKRGYVDVIEHDDDPRKGYSITIKCESRALDYTRTNGRKRNDADQKRRSPGDKFFEHASTRGRQEIYWGRVKQLVVSTAKLVTRTFNNSDR